MATGKQSQKRQWIGVGAAILLVIVAITLIRFLLTPKSVIVIRPDSGEFEIDAHPTGEVEGSEVTILVFRTEFGAHRYREGTVRWHEIDDNKPESLVEKYGLFSELLGVEAYVHASRKTR